MTVTINGNGTVDGLSNLTSGDLTVDTNTLYVDSASNEVGIGTSSPAMKLDVTGGGIKIGYQTAPTWTTDSFLWSETGVGLNIDGFNLKFNTGATRNERMRITSSGSVAVGTTSALGKITSAVGNGGNAFSTRNASGTGIYNAATFYNNGGASLVGTIQPSGSSTSYNTSSDYRLKENVQPMVGALETVAQLKPVTYTWKVDGSNGQGFIAHELQAVVPDCVSGEKDAVETYIDEDGVEQTRPLYQGMDTSFLVATLTAAIQEQQDIIKALETRIQALEGN